MDFLSDQLIGAFLFLWNLYPLWLPIVLALLFWDAWFAYVRSFFFASQKYIVLEIRLPQNILKSPHAMETIISALYDTGGEGTFIDKYWEGKTRQWFSLELASIGGEVKFFIWMREASKDFVESLIYSQYHEAEIHQVEDYTAKVHFDPKENDLFACDLKFTGKSDVFPIKTYVDYGLDKEASEELGKVDPLTPVLEYLGGIGPNEQAWYQFVIRAHKDEIKVPNKWPSIKWDPEHSPIGFYLDTSKASFFKKVDWKAEAQVQIDKILSKIKDKENKTVRQLTEGEKETIKGIERNIGKTAFDVGIRAIYFAAKKSDYKKHTSSNLVASLRQFNGDNGLKPDTKTAFDFSWQNFWGTKLNKRKSDLLRAFKHRGFFYEPIVGKRLIMNAEALASLWHFPGAVATTPNLTRIPSKKAQAPSNLPI